MYFVMNPPNGPQIEPQEIDRLISNFGKKPEPERSQEIQDALSSWKEKFREIQRDHLRLEDRER